ncbi:GNAT family N-acetyltransferase [Stappia sp. ICDLI1TA098]
MTNADAASVGAPLTPAEFPSAHGAGLALRAFTADGVSSADLAFLSRLYASTRAEELAPVPWSEAEKAAFLDMQFHAQHTHYMQNYPDAAWFIIEREGEAIGRLYLERWTSEIRIIDIALLPLARGDGLGAALLADVLAMAEREGRAVGIHVEHNNRAMGLYRRLGFVLVEDKGIYHLLRWRPGTVAADAANG